MYMLGVASSKFEVSLSLLMLELLNKHSMIDLDGRLCRKVEQHLYFMLLIKEATNQKIFTLSGRQRILPSQIMDL